MPNTARICGHSRLITQHFPLQITKPPGQSLFGFVFQCWSCEFDSRCQPLPSEGPNERHLSTSRDLSTFSADRQLATPPIRVVEGALAPYGGHGGAEDAGEAGSTNTDHQRTSARPLGDVGKGAGGSGTTPHRGSRDAYQESISGLRASGGQSFGWLSTAGQLASRVRPTSFLAGAVSDRRAVVRAWEWRRRPLRRH